MAPATKPRSRYLIRYSASALDQGYAANLIGPNLPNHRSPRGRCSSKHLPMRRYACNAVPLPSENRVCPVGILHEVAWFAEFDQPLSPLAVHLIVAAAVQSYCRPAISHPPRITTARPGHDQPSPRCRSATCLRSDRLRSSHPDLAAGIRRVKGVKKLGRRLGDWLTPAQSENAAGKTRRGAARAAARLRSQAT